MVPPRSSVPKPRPDLSFEYGYLVKGSVCVGVDEVGRGCLAGPVVTAAVVLPEWLVKLGPNPHREEVQDLGGSSQEVAALLGEVPEHARADGPWWLGLNDSKFLKPIVREKLAALIQKYCQTKVAWCSVEEIDRWNILRAAMLAMRRSVSAFVRTRGADPAVATAMAADVVLVDGNISPFDTRYACGADEVTLGWCEGRHGFERVEVLVKGDQRSMSIAAASIVAKVYRDRWMTEFDEQYPGYGFADNKGYGAPVHYGGLRRLGPCVLHRTSFAPVAAEAAERALELFSGTLEK